MTIPCRPFRCRAPGAGPPGGRLAEGRALLCPHHRCHFLAKVAIKAAHETRSRSPCDLFRHHDHEERVEEIPEDALYHHRVLAEPHRVNPRQDRETEVEALASRRRDGTIVDGKIFKKKLAFHPRSGISGGRYIPCSVMIADTRSRGVASKAGL
ncbi:MAG: hypothetical protein XE07_0841 [Methanothrix harundinacea]|uniref:Uncharacterized protein n=1 Tax=Methanothrix harundinacea TaxID=301375 RepID=A0A101IK43_9EURY|nr:MAG: hypothetical protein XE07_0841 [Methanothrix harundinacea]